MSKRRVFGLDVFRAAAIIFVVLGHGNFLLQNTFLEGFPYIKMIDGVDLFFVLSGFLIGGILLKEINKKKNFGINDLTTFWKRRWLRTLPNYYLILSLNYVVVSTGIINGDIHQFNWKFLVFLQNFSTPFTSFFWESWSLSIEEWFYIISPLVLMSFLRFMSPKNAFLGVVILMICVPTIYRVCIVDYSIGNFKHDIIFRKMVVTRLDSIAYGLLSAWVLYYFNQSWEKFKAVGLILGVTLITFIVNYKVPNNTFYRQVLYFNLSPISAMLLLPFAYSFKEGKGFFFRAITHISKISYSMYLVNLALVASIIQHNFHPTGEIDSLLKYLTYWTVVILASSMLYKYFEKPFMDLRDPKKN